MIGWLTVTDFSIRRRLAMKIAHVNRPEGKGYVQTFAQLMKLDGLDTMDKTSISAVLWLNDEPERMNGVARNSRHHGGQPAGSAQLCRISARQRVEKELKVRAGGTEAKTPTSPITILKQSLVEREHKIAHLEEQLAAADAGSLFDLNKDSANDIGDVITSTASENKARNIAKRINDNLRTKQKPAG